MLTQRSISHKWQTGNYLSHAERVVDWYKIHVDVSLFNPKASYMNDYNIRTWKFDEICKCATKAGYLIRNQLTRTCAHVYVVFITYIYIYSYSYIYIYVLHTHVTCSYYRIRLTWFLNKSCKEVRLHGAIKLQQSRGNLKELHDLQADERFMVDRSLGPSQ